MSDYSSHKLWGGRFSIPTAAALEALNRSIGTDYRLWPFDINLSQAWTVALWGAGVLTLEESKKIERGLSAVGQKLAAGAQPLPRGPDRATLRRLDRRRTRARAGRRRAGHVGLSRAPSTPATSACWEDFTRSVSRPPTSAHRWSSTNVSVSRKRPRRTRRLR